MPLEIREIGIRLDVGGDRPDLAPRAASGGGGCDDGTGLSPRQRNALIEQCVEAVLTALKHSSER